MKKVRKQGKKKKDAPRSEKQPKEETVEKPFDFGGLPDRDLKKNLGCG